MLLLLLLLLLRGAAAAAAAVAGGDDGAAGCGTLANKRGARTSQQILVEPQVPQHRHAAAFSRDWACDRTGTKTRTSSALYLRVERAVGRSLCTQPLSRSLSVSSLSSSLCSHGADSGSKQKTHRTAHCRRRRATSTTSAAQFQSGSSLLTVHTRVRGGSAVTEPAWLRHSWGPRSSPDARTGSSPGACVYGTLATIDDMNEI